MERCMGEGNGWGHVAAGLLEIDDLKTGGCPGCRGPESGREQTDWIERRLGRPQWLRTAFIRSSTSIGAVDRGESGCEATWAAEGCVSAERTRDRSFHWLNEHRP